MSEHRVRHAKFHGLNNPSYVIWSCK